MIQNMKYEMKKYIITKNNLIILVVLSLLSVGILFWNEESYVVEKNVRQRFFHKIESMHLSAADKQKMEQEKDQTEQEIYEEDLVTPKRAEMKKKGKYADTKLYDYCLLDEVLTCIDTMEKRNKNTAFLAENDQSLEGEYQKEHNRTLVDQKKLNLFVQNTNFGISACLLTIFLLCASFSIEYECNVDPVLRITPKGKEKRVASKIATGMAVALVANLFYGALYCFCQFLFLGVTFQDWKQPLFFVDGCQICASGATIGGFIAKQLLVSVLISILTAFLTMLFSKLFRKSMLSLAVTCVIFGTALLPDLFNDVVFSGKYTIHINDWYFLSEPEFYRLLRTEKLFNPISLLRFQYYTGQPRYLQLSGYQYPAVIFPVLVAALLIVFIGTMLFKRRT